MGGAQSRPSSSSSSRPKPRKNPCTGEKRNMNNMRRQRDQARRENNWHIRDRNRWRSRANNNLRILNKLKYRTKYYPKNKNPTNTKLFAEDLIKKAGIENIKVENTQAGHIFTQSVMKKNKDKKLKNLLDKEEELKSKLLLNDRLLMYRSSKISLLKYIYRVILIIILLVLIIFSYNYIRVNIYK